MQSVSSVFLSSTQLKMNFTDIKRIYFLGIGGIGMSALARYFHKHGADVHGYDRTETDLTRALAAEGMHVHYDDDPAHIPADVDLFVWTPALPKDHRELLAAQASGKPLKKRAEVLGIISRSRRCVAIGGTHGKTTTSTLTAHILRACGVDATAFVGGISGNLQSNFIEGTSDWVVVEADEYDRSFLHLSPEIAVINSIDADHLDIYGSEEAVVESYAAFARNLKPGGTLLVKHSLKPLKKVAKELQATGHQVFTFGIDAGDVQSTNVRVEDGQMAFDLRMPYLELHDLRMPYPGKHNVENATVAAAAALLAGADPQKIRMALADFKGVKRRFEFIVRRPDVAYIDDYAHHPAELEATIGAARMLFPGKKLTGIFQPHLFTRTRDFADQFAAALDKLDEVILLDIYPARELPIEGVSSAMLAGRMQNPNVTLASKSEVLNLLKTNHLETLITLGAGDIETLVKPIKSLLLEK